MHRTSESRVGRLGYMGAEPSMDLRACLKLSVKTVDVEAGSRIDVPAQTHMRMVSVSFLVMFPSKHFHVVLRKLA